MTNFIKSLIFIVSLFAYTFVYWGMALFINDTIEPMLDKYVIVDIFFVGSLLIIYLLLLYRLAVRLLAIKKPAYE